MPLSENRARFDEVLEIIRLAWTRERFSYRGRFYQVEEIAVVPRPVQRPHPPIRVAVHTAQSFAHIGDLGLPIYSGTTTTPLPQLREYMALYRAHLATAGHAWQPDQMALMLPVHVGETGAAARDAMRAGVRRYYENIHAIFKAVPESYAVHLPRLRNIEATLANVPYEKFFRDQGVFGDASEVLDRLQAAKEDFGLSEIICWFDQGSMLPREEVDRGMQREFWGFNRAKHAVVEAAILATRLHLLPPAEILRQYEHLASSSTKPAATRKAGRSTFSTSTCASVYWSRANSPTRRLRNCTLQFSASRRVAPLRACHAGSQV